jgi:DNA-binding NtrC family response regulator
LYEARGLKTAVHEDRATILLGEDELETRRDLEMALKRLGYLVVLARDNEEVTSYVKAQSSILSAVLLDLTRAQQNTFETLKTIRAIDFDLPVIIISEANSTVHIVAAIKCGATDFLLKPFVHEDLRKVFDRAVSERFPKNYVTTPQAVVATGEARAFLGNHPKMKEIQSQLAETGWSDAPVLIQGETGSGKEVLARELHANSSRAGKVFLKMNCAALPSELLESELFGYERGAFTGAVQRKLGMFELAEGGTLLLDEIGDMDIRLQAKLLHVLQDHEFRRIGGKEIVCVNVRVMASTHRDLEKAIADRTFREDLYYRLNVINLVVPPLRERQQDIIPLAEFLIQKHAVSGRPAPVITEGLKHALMTYHWPGNVRELENQMRNLIVFGDPDRLALRLHAKCVPRGLGPEGHDSATAASGKGAIEVVADPVPVREPLTTVKRQVETEAILAALDSTHWNRKQAAAVLQMDYKVFLYRMKKLGIPGKVVSSIAGLAKPPKRFADAGD